MAASLIAVAMPLAPCPDMLCMLVCFCIVVWGCGNIEKWDRWALSFLEKDSKLCCLCGEYDREAKDADTYRGSTWGDNIFNTSFLVLNLVVPLVYFWCSAMPIDVPLSGSVCGREAALLLHFLFSQEENAHWCMWHYLASHWDTSTLEVKDFYIDRGNCQGQASSSARSVSFWRVSTQQFSLDGSGGFGGSPVLH